MIKLRYKLKFSCEIGASTYVGLKFSVGPTYWVLLKRRTEWNTENVM